jgi:hypothetical protein
MSQSHGWCSLRLRFDERELELLKGAERVRGSAIAHTARSDVLRSALTLAKAGQKLSAAPPGGSISLDEPELGLLLGALRFASEEVKWVSRAAVGQEVSRRDAVMAAFPELVQKGVWRSFGLIRELDAVADRLQSALKAGTGKPPGAPSHG